MAFIKKQKVQEIISNAPEGVAAEDIIRGLRRKGHVLEGFRNTPKERLRIGLEADTPAGGFVRGAAKGAGSTLFGLAKIGQKITSGIESTLGLPRSAIFDLETKEQFTKEQGLGEEFLVPKGKAQEIGFHAEQLAEFGVPITKASKAGKVTQVGKAAKAGLRVLRESGEFAIKSAAQTGGDIESSARAFALGLLTNGVLGIAGGVGKAVTTNLPERIMSRIFKTAEDDLRLAYQTVARGKKLNPTLSREVLDRGLRGNSKNMAVFSFKKIDDLERELQRIAPGQFVNLARKGQGKKEDFIGLLDDIEKQFGKGFFQDRASKARGLANKLRAEKSTEIDVGLALQVRRFLDNMRNTSSFKLNPRLSQKQEELKIAADNLRGKIAKSSPKVKELINEERVFIQARDAIIDDAVKRNNRNIIGLVDILAGGGGLVSGGVGQGIGAAAAIRGFQQPFTLTNLAVALDRAGKFTGKTPDAVRKGLRGAITGSLERPFR